MNRPTFFDKNLIVSNHSNSRAQSSPVCPGNYNCPENPIGLNSVAICPATLSNQRESCLLGAQAGSTYKVTFVSADNKSFSTSNPPSIEIYNAISGTGIIGCNDTLMAKNITQNSTVTFTIPTIDSDHCIFAGWYITNSVNPVNKNQFFYTTFTLLA